VQDPNYRKMPIADMIVEAGRLGQKTGAGWFRYEKGDRTPHPDSELARMIKEKTAELGFPRYRGRLMYWSDTIGVAEVYRQIQQ